MGGSDLPDLKEEFNDLPLERHFVWRDLQIQTVLIVNFYILVNAAFR